MDWVPSFRVTIWPTVLRFRPLRDCEALVASHSPLLVPSISLLDCSDFSVSATAFGLRCL